MLKLRSYHKDDSQSCFDILAAKGLKPEGMQYGGDDVETHVLENDKKVVGFFTLTPLRKVYALRHFCVEKPNLHHTKLLERFMRLILLKKGCPILIIGVESGNERLKRAIELQYNTRPYAEKDGHSFYSVNVLEGVLNGTK